LAGISETDHLLLDCDLHRIAENGGSEVFRTFVPGEWKIGTDLHVIDQPF